MASKKTIYTLPTLQARCEDVGDCWEWAGYYTQNGHPQVFHDGRMWLGRRLALVLAGVALKPRHFVIATCNNHRCINPDHLIQRRPQQQYVAMAHAVNHQSVARNSKIAAAKRNSDQAKLTQQDVIEIRSSNASCQELGTRFGVNKSRIASIRRGKGWRDFSSPFAGLVAGLLR